LPFHLIVRAFVFICLSPISVNAYSSWLAYYSCLNLYTADSTWNIIETLPALLMCLFDDLVFSLRSPPPLGLSVEQIWQIPRSLFRADH